MLRMVGDSNCCGSVFNSDPLVTLGVLQVFRDITHCFCTRVFCRRLIYEDCCESEYSSLCLAAHAVHLVMLVHPFKQEGPQGPLLAVEILRKGHKRFWQRAHFCGRLGLVLRHAALGLLNQVPDPEPDEEPSDPDDTEDPEDPVTWLRLAGKLAAEGRHEEAEACRKTAMDLMQQNR